MGELRAGLVGRRYHVVLNPTRLGGHASGLIACDGDNWANAECKLSQIPDILRCQRNGCRQRWPSDEVK